MTAKYYLTRLALDHLESIRVYTLENWGEKGVEKYLSAMIKDFMNTAEFPETGRRKFKEIPLLIKRSGEHYFFYRRMPHGIIIAAIFHTKRDIDTLLEEQKLEILESVESLERDINFT